MEDTKPSHDSNNFNKLFWFCVGLIAYGMLFLTALVWVPIPKENIRFADVILGFVTGSLVTGAIGFLLGGSAPVGKKNTIPGNTIGDTISDGDTVVVNKE